MSYPSNPYDPNVDVVDGMNSATGTSDTELIKAPGVNKKLNITAVVIYNAHASSGTGVYIKSGSTARFGPIPAPSGKGGSIFVLPQALQMRANEACNFACVDAVTTVYVSVIGFISPA